MLNLLKDVFSSLQRHRVRYLVTGGVVAVLHGVPRATFDLAFGGSQCNGRKFSTATVENFLPQQRWIVGGQLVVP